MKHLRFINFGEKNSFHIGIYENRNKQSFILGPINKNLWNIMDHLLSDHAGGVTTNIQMYLFDLEIVL